MVKKYNFIMVNVAPSIKILVCNTFDSEIVFLEFCPIVRVCACVCGMHVCTCVFLLKNIQCSNIKGKQKQSTYLSKETRKFNYGA